MSARVRCELNVNGEARKLLLVGGVNETPEHLPLKLAAYLLFWSFEPIVGATTKLPALSQYEFLPDLVALDPGGDIKLWVECGSTTMHKLGKLASRVPEGRGRIVVVKENPRDAERLRREVDAQLDKARRVEIVHFPEGAWKPWLAAVGEKAEFYGEASELMINGVLNDAPVLLELERA